MMRVQMLLRDGVPDIHPKDWNQRRNSEPDPRRIAVAWALVEAELGRFEGERCHDIRFPTRGMSPTLEVSPSPSPLDDEYPEESPVPDAEVTWALNRVRVEADAITGLTTFGRMLLRRTGFPTRAGRETFVAAGLVVNPGDLPRATLMAFEGGHGLRCTARTPVPQAIVQGMPAEHAFHTPIWGFDAEPRGIVSTLHPRLVEDCARHAALENEAARTPAQEAEFAHLCADSGVRSVRGTGMRDEDYQAWRAYVRESGRWNEVSSNFDEFPTASEIDSREEAHAALMGEWLASREPAGMRFG